MGKTEASPGVLSQVSDAVQHPESHFSLVIATQVQVLEEEHNPELRSTVQQPEESRGCEQCENRGSGGNLGGQRGGAEPAAAGGQIEADQGDEMWGFYKA